MTVHLVAPSPPGLGRVWRTDQSPVLLMNTVVSQATVFTNHTVDMAGPVETGPSLWDWATGLPRITTEEAAALGHGEGSPAEAAQWEGITYIPRGTRRTRT